MTRDELLALLQSGQTHARPYVEQAPGTPDNKWSVLDHKNDWSAIQDKGKEQAEFALLVTITALTRGQG